MNRFSYQSVGKLPDFGQGDSG